MIRQTDRKKQANKQKSKQGKRGVGGGWSWPRISKGKMGVGKDGGAEKGC